MDASTGVNGTAVWIFPLMPGNNVADDVAIAKAEVLELEIELELVLSEEEAEEEPLALKFIFARVAWGEAEVDVCLPCLGLD